MVSGASELIEPSNQTHRARPFTRDDLLRQKGLRASSQGALYVVAGASNQYQVSAGYFAHDIQLVTREFAQGDWGMRGDENLQGLLCILGAHGV